MAQYINKAVVVAEIERRRDLHYKYYMKNGAGSIAECKYDEDKDILSFLATLEVKEVDLEKEFEDFLDNVEGVPRMWHSDEQIEWGKDIAKHFFELGLNARKED